MASHGCTLICKSQIGINKFKKRSRKTFPILPNAACDTWEGYAPSSQTLLTFGFRSRTVNSGRHFIVQKSVSNIYRKLMDIVFHTGSQPVVKVSSRVGRAKCWQIATTRCSQVVRSDESTYPIHIDIASCLLLKLRRYHFLELVVVRQLTLWLIIGHRTWFSHNADRRITTFRPPKRRSRLDINRHDRSQGRSVGA